MTPLLLLLAGCGPQTLPALAPAPADLTVVVADKKVATSQSAQLIVRTWSAPGWSVPQPEPEAEGLTATLMEREGPTVVGQRERWTTTWALTGPDGSYVITLPEVTASGPDDQTRALAPAPVFIDIGVEGPLASGIGEFEAAPPPEGP
ncbi:MAG: hypothetical protein VX265_09885, partial [Myxococcota bacterium]|nr:hypothetical protein [Myxococcota bacterium]